MLGSSEKEVCPCRAWEMALVRTSIQHCIPVCERESVCVHAHECVGTYEVEGCHFIDAHFHTPPKLQLSSSPCVLSACSNRLLTGEITLKQKFLSVSVTSAGYKKQTY